MPIDCIKQKKASVCRPKLFLCCFTGIILCLWSCRTTGNFIIPDNHIRATGALYPAQWTWETIVPGIDYCFYSDNTIPVRWHMARITLNTPGLELVTYPEPEQMQPDTGIFTGITTHQFLKQANVQLAVNGSPFEYPHGFLSSSRENTGIYIAAGEPLSPPIDRYSAVFFYTQTNGDVRAALSRTQSDVPETAETALGGFFYILDNNEIIPFSAASLNSRTAAGIAADGSILYLLCIEGEQKHISTGVTFEETALILQAAGAVQAIQLDGGGSSSLSITGKKTIPYPLRKVATILGFKQINHQNSD